MLLRWILFLSILPSTISIAQSQDASKSAKVHEIFQMTKLHQLSDQRMKQEMDDVDSDISKQLTGKNLTTAEKLRLKKLYEKVNNLLANALSWDKLEPEYEKMYAGAFTGKQLDDIIAFLNTPTGKVLSEKTPILQKQLGPFAHQQWIKVTPEIHLAIKDFRMQVAAKPQSSMPKP